VFDFFFFSEIKKMPKCNSNFIDEIFKNKEGKKIKHQVCLDGLDPSSSFS
jgi:hypothetical protein